MKYTAHIVVSKVVYDALNKAKKRRKAKSLDSVLRHLLDIKEG